MEFTFSINETKAQNIMEDFNLNESQLENHLRQFLSQERIMDELECEFILFLEEEADSEN